MRIKLLKLRYGMRGHYLDELSCLRREMGSDIRKKVYISEDGGDNEGVRKRKNASINEQKVWKAIKQIER